MTGWRRQKEDEGRPWEGEEGCRAHCRREEVLGEGEQNRQTGAQRTGWEQHPRPWGRAR